MCKTSLGIILKPMMAIFGLGSQVDQIQEAIESGDPAEIAVRFVQLICMLFGLTSQCFTGDTLVATENGLRPIEEIQAGEYVWSENTETGKKELKKVLAVSITETETLVKITTANGTQINTTENHPFYVEGKGWKAAAELETGDVLRTQSGKEEKVASVEVEKQNKPVKVYNLEIEDSHTYYVSADEVLVHNDCGIEGGDDTPSKEISGTSYDINKLKKTQPYTYPDGVEKYKNQILSDGPNSIEPIPIRIHNGEVLIVDGHHRYEAFEQLGYERVPIKYLHKSNLGKSLPNGDYYRTLEQLLRDKMN